MGRADLGPSREFVANPVAAPEPRTVPLKGSGFENPLPSGVCVKRKKGATMWDALRIQPLVRCRPAAIGATFLALLTFAAGASAPRADGKVELPPPETEGPLASRPGLEICSLLGAIPPAVASAEIGLDQAVPSAPRPSARALNLEERVEAQRAIEEVYRRHRIWPKENPTPKPPLSAVMPDAAIRAKVEDYLKKSNRSFRDGRPNYAEVARLLRLSVRGAVRPHRRLLGDQKPVGPSRGSPSASQAGAPARAGRDARARRSVGDAFRPGSSAR